MKLTFCVACGTTDDLRRRKVTLLQGDGDEGKTPLVTNGDAPCSGRRMLTLGADKTVGTVLNCASRPLVGREYRRKLPDLLRFRGGNVSCRNNVVTKPFPE